MKTALLLVLCLVALLSGTFLLHGTKEHSLLSIASGVVCALLLVVARFTKKEGRVRASRAAACWAAFLGCAGLSYFSGVLFYRSQISGTKQKLDSLFVSLEERRRVSGAYPEKIDELIDQSHLPWLTRGTVVFHSRADFFWVYFRDVNSGLMDIFAYDSGAKAWTYRQR